MKYSDYVRKEFSDLNFPVFTMADARLALEGRSIGKGYLDLMMHNLVKKREIIRITTGVYTFHKDVAAAGFAFRPFYYGMESALSLRGISDQGTNMVVMTVKNVRAGMRSFDGRNYRVQRIKAEHMFGYDLLKYGDFWIPVSDPEKTLVDMAAIGEHVAETVLESLKKALDKKKLIGYLDYYNINVATKIKEMLGTNLY